MQQRAQTLVELAEGCKFYFVDDHALEYDQEAAEKALSENNSSLLNGYAEELNGVDVWSPDSIAAASKAFVTKETERRKSEGGKKIKLGQLLFPTRIAICGKKGGPDVFEAMIALGQDKTVNRLRIASNYSANR